MKKETIKNALYNVVELEGVDNVKRKGWLVPYEDKYAILPLSSITCIHTFRVSHVKSIRYLNNWYTLR